MYLPNFKRSITLTGIAVPTCGRQAQNIPLQNVRAFRLKHRCPEEALQGRKQSSLSALGQNGTGQPSEFFSTSDGLDAPAASVKDSSTAGSGNGGFSGSNNGGGGGGSGGSGNGGGGGHDDQRSSGPFLRWMLFEMRVLIDQVDRPTFWLLVSFLIIWQMSAMDVETPSEAEEEAAASENDGRIHDIHELAKQLFEDSAHESWPDEEYTDHAPAEPQQLQQSTPGALERLRIWLVSPFSRGGSAGDTPAELR